MSLTEELRPRLVSDCPMAATAEAAESAATEAAAGEPSRETVSAAAELTAGEHGTGLVVLLTLVGVGEHAVGFRHPLEAFFGFLVSRIGIGMQLASELAVSLLDLFS